MIRRVDRLTERIVQVQIREQANERETKSNFGRLSDEVKKNNDKLDKILASLEEEKN